MIILAATPIGNLGDASRRLVEALGRVEVIASEDTRTTIQLLNALGVENRPRLIALHEHNESAKAAEIVELTPGALMPQQFDNPANPEIHRKTTAEEIW
ncbi:MAG: hypothetical protein M3N46_05305, partial [Actinomycetota bacterium]|nr:hypothetical protein [Actinomycetota bacterium]